VGTPVRRCVACRRALPKDALVRLVIADGRVVVDARSRRPGRGAYLCEQSACIGVALRRGAGKLLRALRVPAGSVTVEGKRLRQDWEAARVSAARGQDGSGREASERDEAAQVATEVSV
jgi:uncharacterized protein